MLGKLGDVGPGEPVTFAIGIPLPIFDPVLTLFIVIFYICMGVYLQFKEKRACG